MWLLPMSAASSGTQASRKSRPRSKTLHRVRERADRDEVDAGLGDLAGPLEREPAGGLERGAAGRPVIARTASAIVGASMLSSRISVAAGVEQLAQLVEVGDLDLDAQVRVGGAHGVVGRHDAAGRDDVVVLDHRPVGEAEPVVDAAAAAHGVLLQRALAGQRLAGVEDPRAGALERVRPRPRSRSRRRTGGRRS